MPKTKKHSANVLIITVIIFSAFIMLVTTNLALKTSINFTKENLESQSLSLKAFAFGCSEEALYRLKLDPLFANTTINEGAATCDIALNGSDTVKNIVITALKPPLNYKISLEVTVNLLDNDRNVTINSWTEE